MSLLVIAGDDPPTLVHVKYRALQNLASSCHSNMILIHVPAFILHRTCLDHREHVIFLETFPVVFMVQWANLLEMVPVRRSSLFLLPAHGFNHADCSLDGNNFVTRRAFWTHRHDQRWSQH